MLRNQFEISVEIGEKEGRSHSKIQNIEELLLFSDLLKACKSDIKNMRMIVDEEKSTIHVSGTVRGKTEKITAIVDESYNLKDICHYQDLFEFKPKIIITFELFRVDLHFTNDNKCSYDCSARYLFGSKLLGETFLKAINISKERLHWDKCGEYHYSRAVDTGMNHETLGLKSENCVVFVVKPSSHFKSDILGFMDNVGLIHNNGGLIHSSPTFLKAAILFRNAPFLKSSLKTNCDGDLTDGDIYLVLFKKGIKNQTDTSKHGSTSSIIKHDSR